MKKERRFFVLCDVKGYIVIDTAKMSYENEIDTFKNGVGAKNLCDKLNKENNCKTK